MSINDQLNAAYKVVADSAVSITIQGVSLLVREVGVFSFKHAFCDLQGVIFWSNHRRQSGLKTGRSWSMFENWGSQTLKVQETEACRTGLRVSSPEFFFNYTQIILFLKSYHFGKCSHLIFLYTRGYNNILLRPRDPPSKNLGPQPQE